MTRECTQTSKLRDTDLIVEKGLQVMLPVRAIHHDPKYYPNPEEFDPERFSEEEKRKRPPFSYLAFGEGPRLCIGKFNFFEDTLKINFVFVFVLMGWILLPNALTFSDLLCSLEFSY